MKLVVELLCFYPALADNNRNPTSTKDSQPGVQVGGLILFCVVGRNQNTWTTLD